MAQITGQEKYRSDVERYANHLLDRQKTNADGILYVHKWGTLRLGLFSILSRTKISVDRSGRSRPDGRVQTFRSKNRNWKQGKLKTLEHSLLEPVVWNQDYQGPMNILSRVLNNLATLLAIKAVVLSRVTVQIHRSDLITGPLVVQNHLKTAQICSIQSKQNFKITNFF